MRTCVAVLSGRTIELRWRWYNKVALSDTATTIGTLDKSKIGLTGSHDVYPIAYCDGLNAIGMRQLTTGSDTANFNIVDWVTRATEYPSTTGSECRCSYTLTIQTPSAMIDSFCDKFYWRRTG